MPPSHAFHTSCPTAIFNWWARDDLFKFAHVYHTYESAAVARDRISRLSKALNRSLCVCCGLHARGDDFFAKCVFFFAASKSRGQLW